MSPIAAMPPADNVKGARLNTKNENEGVLFHHTSPLPVWLCNNAKM
jgi:hypothetical protein